MKLSSIATLVSTVAVVLAPAANAISGGYWPVSTPSTAQPWVIGQANSVVWGMGGELGISEFDMQLHNFNKSIMTGFLLVAQNGQYGGELAVSLPDTMATGNGFSLLFMDTKSGEVYYKTDKFPIYAAAASPSNYTTAELPSGTPATTAVITAMPNPTQAWGITVGVAAASGTVTNQAGQAGSGSS
ncbi:hypothetical protein QFC21_001126 [Naganishia friedmannii]|uniref:Uncharacterized protein n=1 Tax=Naganishia friedmannii TaxID=89922 RepID=A0ACC2W9Z6_9TREE|nr:hypothetical protein QFC21_001126 [Naganishia friedmannii]